MNAISNCLLCEEHSLHVYGDENAQIMQCVSCGYTSTSNFKGKLEENEEYKKLNGDMKRWVKETENRFWIPTIMTLPTGMLYPIDVENEMKWAFAPMVDIPEEEQKNYPVPGDIEQYYEQRYDVENVKEYDEFFEGMVELNNRLKEEANG